MPYTHVTIDNTHPRRDTGGNILDAHGGAHFNYFEGRYYNYGVHYMNRDKFMPGFTYVAYSSADFTNWTYHGKLLTDDAPVGFYYRPHVLFNAETNKYVLWFLYFSMYGPKFQGPPDPRYHRHGAQKGVALSDSPTGPFEILDIGVPLAQAESGDHDLFLNDDGSAYIMYTSHVHDFKMYVDRLTPDFTASTLDCHAVDPDEVGDLYPTQHPGCEAPALFKYNGFYHALFGSRTDRGKEGGGLRHYTAPHPMGPYTYIENINRRVDGSVIIPSQQATATPIETAQGTRILWCGDRWETMPALGDSYQHWQLLDIREDDTIAPLSSMAQWSMEIKVGE